MKDKTEWFESAKYGLFIHWGLYSVLAGSWNGNKIHGGEWIMKNGEIPFEEYKQLQHKFNPSDFNADEFVKLASEEFGFKYLCITTKHHDGFSLFDTKVSPYNVMNTPYAKDIVRSLADACDKYGLVFCVYYSQYQDWAEPDAYGNYWDFDPAKSDFRSYLDNKLKPQLYELLTNYGKIGMIWFDTPYEMKKEHCEELVQYVKSLQPDCLINGRIGYGLGDFRETGDRQIPLLAYDGLWECPMTLNDNWGFVEYDENWKTPNEVISILADCASKGGNLLLNVGPDSRGIIPEKSKEILTEVGHWLRVNGESIFNTDVAPQFPYEQKYGCITYSTDKKRLYVHIINFPVNPHKLLITGLKTKVSSVFLLRDKSPVKFTQTYETARDEHRLTMWISDINPDKYDTVIALELEGEPETQKL